MSQNTYHHSIRTARERFLNHGEAPLGLIPDPIHRSWDRCIKHGLGIDIRPELDMADNALLSELKEKNIQLIDHSQSEMENLYAHITGTQSMVILSDSNGTILSAMGDPAFMSKAQRVALQPGVSWREEITGTNAIGTALIEKNPVFVKGAEHYFEQNSFLNCSAAPILDPFGETVGVLDLSGDHRQPHEHTMSLVRMSAQMIENRLFNEHFSQDVILRFHTRAEFIGTLWEGIIVFSTEGKMLAANRSALFQLSLDSNDYLGLLFEDIFGLPLIRFLDSVRHKLSFQKATLNLPSGLHLYVKTDFNVITINAYSKNPQKNETDLNAKTNATTALDRLDTGDSAMHITISKAKLALGHDIAILIEGETGTGKELLAKAIHQSGPRKQGAFVAINCAAIPEGLIESELFGYEEGAFTGARRRGAIGRIQQAHGGTLFLDEIGEMPLILQARLLRVIQERELVPLGGSKSLHVDIAIISATNNRLKTCIERGTFREDLYYRLNGLRLTLPALRDRSDIESLMYRILHDDLGLKSASFEPKLIEFLHLHPWYGNIRQLHHVIKVASIFMQGNILKLEHLPDDFIDEMADKKYGKSTENKPNTASQNPSWDIASNEKTLIKQAIDLHNGNMTVAAHHLGISRATLYRKAKKMSLR